MIRGTTPTITIKISGFTNWDDVSDVLITMKNSNTSIEKHLNEIEREESLLKFELSQEETLSLNANYKVSIQAKILMEMGQVLATKIKVLSVENVLNEEVLS